MKTYENLTTYNPGEIEGKWYSYWENQGYFHEEVDTNKEPFSIVLPPPNVTGMLHMGHALDNTLQDILIRFKRMQGYNVLWMPGTDHAGIATQIKVEEMLAPFRSLAPPLPHATRSAGLPWGPICTKSAPFHPAHGAGYPLHSLVPPLPHATRFALFSPL